MGWRSRRLVIDLADFAELLAAQRVAKVAQVDDAQAVYIEDEHAVLAALRAGHVIVISAHRLNAHVLELFVEDVPGVPTRLVFFQGVDLLGLFDVRDGVGAGVIDVEMRHEHEIGLELRPAIRLDGVRVGNDARALGRNDLEERLPIPTDYDFFVIGGYRAGAYQKRCQGRDNACHVRDS